MFNKYSQESIFAAYNVPITNSLFISPIRKDKTPTCKLIYHTNGTLMYLDNRPGEFRGDVINFVKHIKNISYKQALLDVYKTMNNGTISTHLKQNINLISNKEKSTIKLNFKEFTKEDLDYWNSYYINIDLLNNFNIKSVKECFIKNSEGEYFNCRKKDEMCFAYLFPDNTVKVYFPERKAYRFVSNTTTIQGLSQLKEDPEYVVITKSLKDVIVLHLLGIPALAPQTESIIPSSIIDSFDKTYLLYDNDIAGRKASIKVRNKHPEVPILLIPQEYGVKDISDFIKKYGIDKTKQLIEYGKKRINKM